LISRRSSTCPTTIIHRYDFGITSSPKQEDVDDIVSALKNEFALVLITEHMDESLIFMQQIFCWKLEDVLHYALKVCERSCEQLLS
jgi:hypothetical protein